MTLPQCGHIAAATSGTMSDIIRRIVEIDGLVHEDEIVARVRQLWGLGRAGSRIQTAVDSAIAYGVSTSGIIREGAFCTLPRAKVTVRERSQAASAGLRKPSMLPPAEIQAAILAIIDQHQGASTQELCTTTARLLGFAARSAQLKSTIEDQIAGLGRDGALRVHQAIWVRLGGQHKVATGYTSPVSEPVRLVFSAELRLNECGAALGQPQHWGIPVGGSVPDHRLRRERRIPATRAHGVGFPGCRHACGCAPHEAWSAADPFRGGFKVLITGPHAVGAFHRLRP